MESSIGSITWPGETFCRILFQPLWPKSEPNLPLNLTASFNHHEIGILLLSAVILPFFFFIFLTSAALIVFYGLLKSSLLETFWLSSELKNVVCLWYYNRPPLWRPSSRPFHPQTQKGRTKQLYNHEEMGLAKAIKVVRIKERWKYRIDTAHLTFCWVTRETFGDWRKLVSFLSSFLGSFLYDELKGGGFSPSLILAELRPLFIPL